MNELVGWVPTRSGALWTGLTEPPPGAPSGPSVVLVPPFGWEGMASARQLRGWAHQLAGSGHRVLRYHPPGEGDSEGDAAAQDLATWSAALTDLVGHLTAHEPGPVVLVGLGLGGLVALQALHDGCRADALVLWTTPGRGRAALRELRAFASLVGDPGAPADPADRGPAADDPHAPDGTLWVHGYPLGATAQAQLEALDVSDLTLPPLARVLLLGRGTLPPDRRLVTALEQASPQVTVADGPGYDVLTAEPRLSRPPEQVQRTVVTWLAATEPSGVPGARRGSWPLMEPGERSAGAGPVRAVVTPAADARLTLVLLGAGATPRGGPNRLWTDAARRWRGRGVASVRVDVEGVGEADGPLSWETGAEGFYDPSYAAQVEAVLTLVREHDLPQDLVLVGLCSGAYWAAQTALTHPGVRAVVLLNPEHLVWPPPLADLGLRGRLAHLTDRDTVRSLVHDPRARRDAWGRVRQSVRLLADRVVGEPEVGAQRPPATATQVLRTLRARDIAVTLVGSPGEPSLTILDELPGDLEVRAARLTGPVGAHTLSTRGLRAQAEAALDAAVEDALQRLPRAAVS